MIIVTYISGELLEGVKHVEAMEVYDPGGQRVVVSGSRGLREIFTVGYKSNS